MTLTTSTTLAIMARPRRAAPRPSSWEVGGLNIATEAAVVEAGLGRLAGVSLVEANPVGPTATVTYDPAVTSVAALSMYGSSFLVAVNAQRAAVA